MLIKTVQKIIIVQQILKITAQLLLNNQSLQQKIKTLKAPQIIENNH
jgi:hypothetical protein